MEYTIGLDFGTLSVRGVLVNIDNGHIISSSVSKYQCGVMDAFLPNGIPLPHDFALQDANDYIESMNEVLFKLINTPNIHPKEIIGIGVDFTSSTILPITKDGIPLSSLDLYKDNPHAYVKLWKHHRAEKYAVKITDLAIKRNEPWIKRYGNKISSEWMLPKVYETLKNAPKVFDQAEYFIDAGDFITFYLTGKLKRSACQAGYKDQWHYLDGYPSNDYLKHLDKKLEHLYETKLSKEVVSICQEQGKLKPEIASNLGLSRIPVAVAVIDAHVAAPACDVTKNGDMLMILGTSSCDIVLSDKEVSIPGIQGVVKDGVIPDLFAYESGQPAVGDMFSWYIENHIPREYYERAVDSNQNIYQYMEDRINLIPKEKPRLLALDWWNGNRSVLVDPDLTGLIVGYNLQTTPEDIYRALIEASAFGKRRTIDAYKKAGVNIKRLVACGGLATKNKYLLQCYANILNQPIYYTEEEYAPALGAAIFGTSVAKRKSIQEISKKMSRLNPNPIEPTNDYNYDDLYQLYIELHDCFGLNTKLMKKLKQL